jgi:hypothetical protein
MWKKATRKHGAYKDRTGLKQLEKFTVHSDMMEECQTEDTEETLPGKVARDGDTKISITWKLNC